MCKIASRLGMVREVRVAFVFALLVPLVSFAGVREDFANPPEGG